MKQLSRTSTPSEPPFEAVRRVCRRVPERRSTTCPLHQPRHEDRRARDRPERGGAGSLRHEVQDATTDLGMRPKVARRSGSSGHGASRPGLIVVISAMPEGGLTTLTNVSPAGDRPADAGRVISVEEKSSTSRSEMENIEQVSTTTPRQGRDARGRSMPKLISQVPGRLRRAVTLSTPSRRRCSWSRSISRAS